MSRLFLLTLYDYSLLQSRTMFDYLRGLLAELTPTYAVIECGGVGYIVTISLQTYTKLEDRKDAEFAGRK